MVERNRISKRNNAAPAFIKELFFCDIQVRMPDKLVEVQDDFNDQFNLDIQLTPEPKLNYSRTRPEKWGPTNNMVIYTRATQAGELASSTPHGSIEAPRSAEPGKGPYESTIFVEFYCLRHNGTAPELSSPEILNIVCQNTLWAAYLCVIDIGLSERYDDYGLKLVDLEDGLQFDNTRGSNPGRYPLTEWGMFHFTPTVQ